MDFASLQYFLDVIHRGSFAAVARQRSVDPSIVSRAVASLEASLNVRLLHRTTRRLTLTEAGAEFALQVEPLLEELRLAGEQMRDASQQIGGTLRIAAPVSFAQLNIVPLLPTFAALHPTLSIDLRLTDSVLDLIEERLDVAIRLGPLSDSALIARRLARMDFTVCASPAYVARYGAPRTPADLSAHNCLLLDMPGFNNQWRFVDDRGARSEVQVQGRLRTSNAVALKDCALAGMGIISQARWIVGRELQQGTLIDLFPTYHVDAAGFDEPAMWLLYPTRTYLPRKVRAFVEFLTEAFADGPPWSAEQRFADGMGSATGAVRSL